MGEASMNPHSTQYRGKLPSYDFGTQIRITREPSHAFRKRMEGVEVTANVQVGEEDLDVVVYVLLSVVLPSRVTDQWPTAHFPVVELKRMSVKEALAGGMAVFERENMPAQAQFLRGFVESKDASSLIVNG
jgi:hypothetical protein